MLGINIFYFLAALTVVLGKHAYEMEIEKGLGKFSWSNCNKTAVPIAFSALSVSPDPVKFGEAITVSFTMEVTQDIGTTSTLQADITATLTVQGTAVDVCNYNPAYCHYTDLCTIVSKYKDKCPDVIKKLGNDCQCPLKKNTYAVKDATYQIPSIPVAIEGEFHVIVHLKESDKPVGCLDLHLCMGSC